LIVKPYQKLQTWWADTGVRIPTRRASEAEVHALELKYEVELPIDFREYLLESCPVTEEMDISTRTWWSLDRIKNIPDECDYQISNPRIAEHATTYLFFADWGLWCSAWAIACGQNEDCGRVANICDRETLIADSFEDLVDKCIRRVAPG
jgi:hypothetical protein